MKTCTTCKTEKEECLFNNSINHEDGKNPTCKSCVNAKQNKYRDANRLVINEKSSLYRMKNAEVFREKERIYSRKNLKIPKNAQRNRERRMKYYYENKDKSREAVKRRYNERRKEDPLFKLRCATKSLIQVTLKRKGVVKNSRSKDILGADIETVKKHIERQFKKGMTWGNYGIKGWHIDHKIPLASAKTEEELLKLFHYTNLQPLWAKENFDKRDKILPFQVNMGI